MSYHDDPLARVRARRLEEITESLRRRLAPFREGVPDDVFEDEIGEMAERQLLSELGPDWER